MEKYVYLEFAICILFEDLLRKKRMLVHRVGSVYSWIYEAVAMEMKFSHGAVAYGGPANIIQDFIQVSVAGREIYM